MSTSSTLSAVLSAVNGSTGLDVDSAVAAILYADRAPERAWQAQQTALTAQTTAINTLNTDASSLSDQLTALQSLTGSLNSVDTTSSDPYVVTATATPGTASGSHTVVVSSLAATGSWYSNEEASSSSTISGSFDITSGGTTTSITLDSSDDTLAGLATYINGQSLGVTASVITDANGARLSVVANNSGTAADFSISNASGLGFTQATTGANASLTVDGVPITSASNTVTGAVSGVTLNLVAASKNETVNINLSPNVTDIATAITSFVSAYNTLMTDVNNDITYRPSSGSAGPLQSDSAAQSFFSDLLASVNFSGGSGAITSLSSLGITATSAGLLTLDSSTLQNAITANPTAVATFFQGTSGTGTGGFASALTSTLTTYTDPSVGAFTIDLQSIASENTDLTNETNTLEVYLANQQTTLTTEYNNANIALQQLSTQIKNMDALLGLTSSSSSS